MSSGATANAPGEAGYMAQKLGRNMTAFTANLLAAQQPYASNSDDRHRQSPQAENIR